MNYNYASRLELAQRQAEAAVREAFLEVNIGNERTKKSLSTQPIYVCLALLKRSYVWGLILDHYNSL